MVLQCWKFCVWLQLSEEADQPGVWHVRLAGAWGYAQCCTAYTLGTHRHSIVHTADAGLCEHLLGRQARTAWRRSLSQRCHGSKRAQLRIGSGGVRHHSCSAVKLAPRRRCWCRSLLSIVLLRNDDISDDFGCLSCCLAGRGSRPKEGNNVIA